MAVSSVDTLTGPYTTNGVTTTFPFAFKAMAEDELRVFRVDDLGVETTIDAGAYDVTLGEDGGSVIFSSAPAAGNPLYIGTDPDFTQQITFENQGAFLPEVMNEAFDRAAVKILAVKDAVDRSPQTPLTGGVEGKFAAVKADGSWGFAEGTGNDPALRTDLAQPDGSALIAYNHDDTYGRTLGGVVQPLVNPYNYPFNGTGDGGANDRQAIQDANDFLVERFGGGIIEFTHQHRAGTTDLRLDQNVSIMGRLGISDPGNPEFPGREGNLTALRAAPKLLLDPDVKINAEGSQSISNLYIVMSQLALDGTDEATDYDGSAIVATVTDSVDMSGLALLGFNKAIFGDGSARLRVANSLIDCVNGVHFDNGFDINTCFDVRCYNVLQADVDGHDPRVLRDGTAFLNTGASFNGGHQFPHCFAYGYRNALKAVGPGSFSFPGFWADGPTDAVTHKPLWADCVGIAMLSGAKANAEPQGIGIKTSAQAIGIHLGANTYGTSIISGLHSWECVVGIQVDALNTIISSAAIRGYFEAAIKYGSRAAADSSSLIGIHLYDRQVTTPTPTDINCASGDPYMSGVRYVNPSGDAIRLLDKQTISTVRQNTGNPGESNGRVIIPRGGTADIFTLTTNTGATPHPAGILGSIEPVAPGREITLVSDHSGSTIQNSSPNYVLKSGDWASAAGKAIHFIGQGDGKWHETWRT